MPDDQGAIPSAQDISSQLGLSPATDSSDDVRNVAKQLGTVSEQRRKETQPLLDQEADTATKGAAASDDAFRKIEPFKPLPPPDQRQYQTDPMQSFFSIGSVVGILASAFTHQPWEASFNAAAAAIHARNDGDNEAYDHAFKEWQENTKALFDRHQAQREDFEAIQEKTKGDLGAFDAAIRAHNAKFDDQTDTLMRQAGLYGQADDRREKFNAGILQMQDQYPKIVEAGTMTAAMLKLGAAQKLPPDDPKRPQAIQDAITQLQQIQEAKSPYGSMTPAKMAGISVQLRTQAAALPDGDPRKAQWNAEADQADAAISKTKSNEAPAATISDDAANLVADEFIGGNRQSIAGYGRSPANQAKLQNAIAQRAKDLHLSGPMINALQAVYSGEVQGQRTLGTRAANMEVAANEVGLMAPLALEASAKVDRTQYPSLNAVILDAERGKGDENVVQFGLAANSLIYTYAKFLNPTGIPTDSDKARAADILNTAWSKGQFSAAIDQIKREIASGQAAISSTKGEISRLVTGDTSHENPATPANKGEYDRLKSGDFYRKPDDPIGVVRQKP